MSPDGLTSGAFAGVEAAALEVGAGAAVDEEPEDPQADAPSAMIAAAPAKATGRRTVDRR